MLSRRRGYLAASALLAGVAGLTVQPTVSAGAEPRPRPVSHDDRDEAAHEDWARESYEATLAVHAAAAEAARTRGEERDALSAIDAAMVDDYGCPDGTKFWQRDRITDLCATLCRSDADCGPEDGRCRMLDLSTLDREAPTILVDELTEDEQNDALAINATESDEQAWRVCDPFWDVEGALDADLATEGATPLVEP